MGLPEIERKENLADQNHLIWSKVELMKERQLCKGVKLLKRAKIQGVIHRCGQVKQYKLVTQGDSTSSVIHKPSLSLDSHSALIVSCFTWPLDD